MSADRSRRPALPTIAYGHSCGFVFVFVFVFVFAFVFGHGVGHGLNG